MSSLTSIMFLAAPMRLVNESHLNPRILYSFLNKLLKKPIALENPDRFRVFIRTT
ncbi:conserved hypothetical protein [Roseibium sp. TrichSKD4]|nr:conserved hypothetical protein [Roseibium sp. TrichSKD4]